jgi:hypothetical protein
MLNWVQTAAAAKTRRLSCTLVLVPFQDRAPLMLEEVMQQGATFVLGQVISRLWALTPMMRAIVPILALLMQALPELLLFATFSVVVN